MLMKFKITLILFTDFFFLTNTNSAGWFNIFLPTYMQFDGDKWVWGWKRGNTTSIHCTFKWNVSRYLLILWQGWYYKTHLLKWQSFTNLINQNMNRWKIDWILFWYDCRRQNISCYITVRPSICTSNRSNNNSSWLWPNFIEIFAQL